MTKSTISTTLRLPQAVAHNLDQIANRHGFATRSKFLIHAGLTYDGTADDRIASEIARTNFALHQANLASAGKLHLLKPRDIECVTEHARRALEAVIDRNIG